MYSIAKELSANVLIICVNIEIEYVLATVLAITFPLLIYCEVTTCLAWFNI